MMSLVQYYTQAAKKSQWNYKLWLRYLNKSIHREKIELSDSDVETLIRSGNLEVWQAAFLKLAVQPGSLPWKLTVKYSEPADNWRFHEFLEKRKLKSE
jgi:hypothetical protein